ncbi:alpha/beta hydrolase [Actinoplanes sp. Pm04-4]|uniref:Alpha/beta hydrolase n=1 Tax=Paractinoplanes pyxinae TaxID=2997416 RepID=A0ABT4BFG8_9ACTN|nr:alpha/beta hydrolase [Actinoplanes pyxinae]MCY1145280.1 alpha/beta hydrolase [Actinoplanes pyxinae]
MIFMALSMGGVRASRAALAVITLLAYGAAPAYARPATTAPAITWATCPEDAQVQCGTIKVPADWAQPTGPTTTLTMARRKATDPGRRIGTLLINPGGPGGSAFDFTLNATAFFGEQVRRRFDIVGVDPRGVGRSSPVLCSRDLVDAQPSVLIESEQQYAAMVAYNRRLAADCAARSGPVFGHLDTASVARDYDTVRGALGEAKISFYGASYGTLIGQEYARLYPARLRALVLDGVMDHSADLDRFLVQQTEAAQDSFGEFVKWCARDKSCVLRGHDIPKLFVAAMARARAGQLINPYDPPNKLTVAQLTMAAFTSFYEPQWYSFAYYLRDAMMAGRRAPKKTPPVDLIDYSFAPVFCEDWRLPVTGYPELQRRLRTLAAGAPQMLVSPLAMTAVAGCLGWPSPPDNPQRPVPPLTGAASALLVNARHDPATAYAWAQQVTAHLGPSARLLTYDGWGHVVYNKSPCVAAAVDTYLFTLTPVAAGTRCPAVEPPPFGIG